MMLTAQQRREAERRGAVLVIDRDPAAVRAIRGVGEGMGLEVRVAEGLTGGLRALGEGPWMLTLLSLDLVGVDLELVERVARERTTGAVALLSSRPTVALSMQAARLGLLEVFGRPVDVRRLKRVLRVAQEAGARVPLPEAGVGAESGLVGRSPALLEVFQAVGQFAGSEAAVLISGERGTGKELVARSLHRSSPRSGQPFVELSCGALPEDLLEAELFGVGDGGVEGSAGRLERASGGTLFLDEIGELSRVVQTRLLRVLREGEVVRSGGEGRVAVDVRLLAATRHDLEALVAAGEFREDLYQALAVVRLHLPPLRERGEDLRELVFHYAARFAAAHARPIRFVADAALERLEAYSWPGNVRELMRAVERGVLAARGETLRAEDLELGPPRATSSEPLPGYSAGLTLAQLEALHIARVLRDTGGHVGRAAEVLGVHRNTVARKLREYGISG